MRSKPMVLASALISMFVFGALSQAQNRRVNVSPVLAGRNGVGVPSCLLCPAPKYSDRALKAKFEGDVLIAGVVGLDGRATNLRVLKGAGLGLEEKAIAAVKQWRFRPAQGPNGEPVAVITDIHAHFSLPQGAPQAP